ncbi:MAG: O-antigen ligase family protein [Patescibacteria group bacterium]|jgi:O-antigen ligase
MISWQKINRFLLWSAFFVLPWQFRHTLIFAEHQGQFFEYASISIYLSDILIILVLLTWFIFAKKTEFKTGPAVIFWPLTFLIVWLWISVGYGNSITGNWAVGLNNAAHFSLFYLFYIYLVNAVKNLSDILLPLAWGTGLQAIIAIGQYGLNRSLGLKFLGESPLQPAELGIPVVLINGVRHLRAHGTLPHANVLGGYLALVLPWLGLIYLGVVKAIKRPWIYWLILTVGSVALLFSFSRSAWLAIGLTCLVVIIWRLISGRPRWQGWDGGLIAIVMVIALSQYPALVSRFHPEQTALEQGSVTARIDQLQQAKLVYDKYPLTGVGVGQYTIYLLQQDTNKLGWQYNSKLSSWVYNLSRQIWDYQPVHNIFLLVLAELGWVGEVLFIVLLGGLIWVSGSLFKLGRSLLGVVALSSVTAIVILGLFDHYLWTLQPGRLILFLTIGIIAVLYQNKNKEIANE